VPGVVQLRVGPALGSAPTKKNRNAGALGARLSTAPWPSIVIVAAIAGNASGPHQWSRSTVSPLIIAAGALVSALVNVYRQRAASVIVLRPPTTSAVTIAWDRSETLPTPFGHGSAEAEAAAAPAEAQANTQIASPMAQAAREPRTTEALPNRPAQAAARPPPASCHGVRILGPCTVMATVNSK